MDKPLLIPRRKSQVEKGEIYFWTATINKWRRLLEKHEYKQIILDSLQYLSKAGKIDVFAFIIMPNHIHLIWRVNEPNGKESPHGSFLKYTAHIFQKMLQQEGGCKLRPYRVDATNKNYEFWQRDSLAIHLLSREMALQKLTYLHNNPLAEHWQLCDSPESYYYSSARFYETGIDDFGFLKHIMDVL